MEPFQPPTPGPLSQPPAPSPFGRQQPTSPFGQQPPPSPFGPPPRRIRPGTVLLVALVAGGIAAGGYYLARSDDEGARPDLPVPQGTRVVPEGRDPGGLPEARESVRQAIGQVKDQLGIVQRELRRTEDPAARTALKAQIAALREALRQLRAELAKL